MNIHCPAIYLTYECNRDADKKREGKNRVINLHTTRFPHHELGLSHMPQRRRIIQVGKNIFYSGPCVTVFQPAQLNRPPQFIAESKTFCPLRFPRPDPLHNFVDCEDIRLELNVGVVSAQYLDYPRLTVFCNEHDRTNTHLVDDHPESVAIGLPGRSVVL